MENDKRLDLHFSKVREVKSPSRGTPKSAGIDFYVPDKFETTTLLAGGSILIPSGIKVNIPEGYALIAFNKSGVSTKKSLIVGACVVDEDYQGEVHIHLFNNSSRDVEISAGDKIVQFILIPVLYADIVEIDIDSLYTETTVRGEGKFGSTDKGGNS
jgi:dUTP pyrophosphatase